MTKENFQFIGFESNDVEYLPESKTTTQLSDLTPEHQVFIKEFQNLHSVILKLILKNIDKSTEDALIQTLMDHLEAKQTLKQIKYFSVTLADIKGTVPKKYLTVKVELEGIDDLVVWNHCMF